MRRLLPVILVLAACRESAAPTPPRAPAPKPSILLVTLDTTRADAIGAHTPAFQSVASRGRTFRWAYATAPQTLPSHSSMLTGLYPAGHGVHENARALSPEVPLVTERLKVAGYQTAAFVSSFSIARRFGLARGFDVYDDVFAAGAVERGGKDTVDRALAWRASARAPYFLWVHLFDPHAPYNPPAPYRGYRGEVEFMDSQLARLLDGFDGAVILASDHGEGLGEHGEAEHGYLPYQATMHVPMAIAGPDVAQSVVETPVSTRRVFHTILDFAGVASDQSLRGDAREVVMGEAMVPFLNFGWQPQVIAVEGTKKALLAGRLEVFDVANDPAESRDISAQAQISRELRAALRDYPLPSPAATKPESLDDEARRKLASLGYISSSVQPVVRQGAPRPADMAHLFATLDQSAALFVAGQYAKAVPLLQRIIREDPNNVEATIRLAVSHSSLGQNDEAFAAFRRAEALAPGSRDVQTYLALHLARGAEWQKAEPMLERITKEEPSRLPPLEALALIRERQRRIPEAVELRRRVYALRLPSEVELRRLALMQMSLGRTADAIASFEWLRAAQGSRFDNHLELGALYLAARRFTDGRDALDRVAPSHPDYAMALFKRAQVSVLLKENDAPSRIEMARRHATPLTRDLIARERLFGGTQN